MWIKLENMIEVRPLQNGDILRENDMYLSTSGKYEVCPCPGIKYIKNDVPWYRPLENESNKDS